MQHVWLFSLHYVALPINNQLNQSQIYTANYLIICVVVLLSQFPLPAYLLAIILASADGQ